MARLRADAAGARQEAAGLLALLRDAGVWAETARAGAPGLKDLDAAVAPVMDRLVELGPPSVRAILDGGRLEEGWYAGWLGEALHALVRAGAARGALDRVLALCADSAPFTGSPFVDHAEAILSTAGEASVPHLRRVLRDAPHRDWAVHFAGEVLEESDPAWAASAALDLLGGLMAERSVVLADTFSPYAASVAGEAALPLVEEVVRRKVEEGYGRLPLFGDAVDALLRLGRDPRDHGCLGLAESRTQQVEAIILGTDGDMGGDDDGRDDVHGDDDGIGSPPSRPPEADAGPLAGLDLGNAYLHGRPRLAGACAALGLDASGSREQLADRLADFHGMLLEAEPEEFLSTADVRALDPDWARVVCEASGLGSHQDAAVAANRLAVLFDAVRRDIAPPPAVSRARLEAMSMDALRGYCAEWDVSSAGGRRAVVARLLAEMRREGRAP